MQVFVSCKWTLPSQSSRADLMIAMAASRWSLAQSYTFLSETCSLDAVRLLCCVCSLCSPCNILLSPLQKEMSGIQQSLLEMIQCSVCWDQKEEQKVLPCQHTLCLECLLKLQMRNNRIKCPQCNKVSEEQPITRSSCFVLWDGGLK